VREAFRWKNLFGIGQPLLKGSGRSRMGRAIPEWGMHTDFLRESLTGEIGPGRTLDVLIRMG
jgi:hypothetical protein